MNTTKALGDRGEAADGTVPAEEGLPRCWPASGAAGTESWIWWPGTETAPSALWR